jgi:ATP-binding cassette subfamily B multidrug efflux pump
MLTMMSIMLPRAAVAADRIDEVIQTKSSIRDAKEPEKVTTHNGVVQFSHVNFKYPGAEEDVLHDIDFTAEPGQTTAIIGSTGCGKSTLVNLIPRLYDVTEGSITLDGKDIRNISMSDLREEIGFVPQKGVLFSGTIASNLRFGKNDATDGEIKKAAEIAQATEFIEAKDDKYESAIAQGGSNVSGGQKQRLAIARAIAKDPKIFIFDDSFSALDLKTDAALRKALAENVTDSTVIIVAQRISTILHAEQILVLDEGKIVGKGTHEELLRSCEVYQQIAKSQLSAKELGLEESEVALHE